ncbi:hypothetical protein [Streptomyces sp. NPDC050504]|uniref:hypothetical protein n=1 Tax=Streptomyces sp. NPDC050504 TaxID=3365618 RepID=UPI0037BDBF09
MPAPKSLALRPQMSTPAPAQEKRAGSGAVRPGAAASSNAAVTAALAAGRVPPALPGQVPPGAQNMVGNGAVAAAGRQEKVRREAEQKEQKGPQEKAGGAREGGDGAVQQAAAPAASGASGAGQAVGRCGPHGDPKFVVLKGEVRGKGRGVAASHRSAGVEAGAAQQAAVAPRDDEEAQGKTANAEKMNEARPGEFDREAFVRAVERAVADKAPKNLDEADRFASSGRADEVRGEVQGRVGEGRQDSAGEIAATTAAPPDTSAAVPKEVVPLTGDRPPGAPGAPRAALAVPDRLPPAATDLSAGPAGIDRSMAHAQVTEAQLEKGNEPAFDRALGEKKTAERHAATAPGALRGHEAGELRAAAAQAQRTGTAAMAAMGAQRALTGQRVDGGKGGAKSRDEERRARVTAVLQGVFDIMKQDVEAILAGLDRLVEGRFGDGERAARQAFTAEHGQRMREYKDRRYSGVTGKLRWVKDKFAGLPAEADRIFERARDGYVGRMRQLIGEIATLIGTELGRAKRRIAQGRGELQAAVRALPAELRAIGREAAGEFEGRFEDLTQSVRDKGTELVDTLATRYTQALTAVDEEIAAQKEKNKGLVARALDAVGAAVRTILELRQLLLSVLAKAAQAVLLILKDPVGFLKNLVQAIGAGLRLFIGNIGRHLQQGILSWLLGRTAEAGIELPARFDAAGVFRMLASLLGVTWANLRERILRRAPGTERALTAAETAVPLVAEVRRRGAAGLWEEVRGRVGDLRKDLLDKVIAYVTPTIVVAGITWILSLLNPASAFVRAVKLLIDIVRFVVTQARQIFEFVNAVLDAVIAVARGAGGGVPGMVERALARSVPVLLGVLAAVLGVGGIASRVKGIVQAMAKPVNRVIDRAIDKIAGLVKKLWAKIKPKSEKKKPRKDGDDREDRKDGDGRRRPAGKRRPARRGRPDRRRPKPRRDGKRRDRRKQPDKRSDKRSESQKQRALDAALREATALLAAEGATVKSVRRGLPAIKKRHKLTSIKLVRETKERYHIDAVLNPRGRTRPEDLADKFPYQIAQIAPTGSAVRTTLLSRVVKHLPDIDVPMLKKAKDPTTGFVVNMAATPGEIKPDVASRYVDEAWKDTGGKSASGIALTRTAVVIGINTFERLDRKSAKGGGKPGVLEAMGRISPKSGQLLGVFGFLWTPRWMSNDKREVALSEVRHAYSQLTPAEQQTVIAQNETGWRDGKLPYGVFRDEVLGHAFTKRAVHILKDVNTQVHIVSQDADTGVASKSGAGVLHAYDRLLAAMDHHPLLTIGGYHFEGFKWGENDDPRMKQLTLLSNELDRAIRVAIAKRFPEMLYPTEPNMLVKAWDSRGTGGIFQRARKSGLIAVEQRLFGLRSTEGRHLRIRLMQLFGPEFSVAYAPEASTTTSPVPENEDRGLAVRPRAVELAAEGKMRKRGGGIEDIRVSHRAYATLLQSQSYANARTMAREFVYANPALMTNAALREALHSKVFVHVENVVLKMSDNPRLTATSPEVTAELAQLARSVEAEASRAERSGSPEAGRAVEKAHAVVQEIVKALSSPELTDLWTRLRTLLDEIMSSASSRSGGEPR